MSEQEHKWFWMMDYCLAHRIPPAQEWAWNMAKLAYAKHQEYKSDT